MTSAFFFPSQLLLSVFEIFCRGFGLEPKGLLNICFFSLSEWRFKERASSTSVFFFS